MGEKKIKSIVGWVLTAPDEEIKGGWYICWEGVFDTKKAALFFAQHNHWPKPYRAVRGEMRASHV